MAGRRGGRTKLVRRLQVAARYPGIGRFSGYLGTWYWVRYLHQYSG